MSSTLRAVAVASCTALLVAGAATAAGATGGTDFNLKPVYGQVGTTLNLTGAAFTGDTGAAVNGVAAQLAVVSPHHATVVVPTGATSGPVTVTNGVTTLTGPDFVLQQDTTSEATVSTNTLTFAKPLVITGTETATLGGAPVVGESAGLQHKVAGSDTWTRARGTGLKRTGASGRASWTLKPAANGKFRIHFRMSHAYAGATTPAQKVKVFPRVQIHPIHTVPELTDSTIRGAVHPHLPGTVYLQKFTDGAWHHAGHQDLVDGHFAFTINPSSFKSLKYRVVRRSDGVHSHGLSSALHLQVVHRQLVFGATGPDVLALQHRLRKLHYDVGPASSTYSYDLLHAVTVFEKVQGLHPDGQAGVKVWKALDHPKVPHLRYPYPNDLYSVEVNLTKQVLMIAKNGKLWRILDTSTAGGYLYPNTDGVGYSRAITPTGHFSIQYKIEGIHKSKLGTLYYPSYFTNTGYAIHGEGNGTDGGEVPPYANSHGCVRITDNAVLRYYFHVFTVGTSVWVYH